MDQASTVNSAQFRWGSWARNYGNPNTSAFSDIVKTKNKICSQWFPESTSSRGSVLWVINWSDWPSSAKTRRGVARGSTLMCLCSTRASSVMLSSHPESMGAD
ncbi:hypothetical protein ILYODFUR_033164 [Ilyodon furcidens]|uniref:Uncharacterized protein n=1 Tax=Ilyodon furcidens TaxID=33524 RepID=A0ABV0U437_9TELE